VVHGYNRLDNTEPRRCRIWPTAPCRKAVDVLLW